jgi:hypothetical protein
MGKELGDSLGISYIETSAKDSTNVEEAFRLMVTETSNMYGKPDIKPVESPSVIEPD